MPPAARWLKFKLRIASSLVRRGVSIVSRCFPAQVICRGSAETRQLAKDIRKCPVLQDLLRRMNFPE